MACSVRKNNISLKNGKIFGFFRYFPFLSLFQVHLINVEGISLKHKKYSKSCKSLVIVNAFN